MFHMLGHGHGQKNTQKKYVTRQALLRSVWRGNKRQRQTKMKKDDLRISAFGRVVPLRRSLRGQRNAFVSGWTRKIQCWRRAFKHVYDSEGLTGFMKLKKKGTGIETEHYKKVREAYAKELEQTPEPDLGGGRQTKITGFLVPVKTEPKSPEVQIE